jgi:hypothetical protein
MAVGYGFDNHLNFFIVEICIQAIKIHGSQKCTEIVTYTENSLTPILCL